MITPPAAETAIWLLENGLNGQRTLGMDDQDRTNVRDVITKLKSISRGNSDDHLPAGA